MATEQSLRDLAPAGSRWRFRFDPPDKVLVSEGLYPNWRDPAEWTDGVAIVPVVILRSERHPNDWGTVREADLRDGTYIPCPSVADRENT